MARREPERVYFDDLAPGDEWLSTSRTITESDVITFAGLSGDFNAIHVDYETAQRGPFRKPVAHGLLGLAVASGLGSTAPRVETLALLEILEWRFVHPIAFGDTVTLLTRVEAIEPRARGRRALVTWHRSLMNQHGQVVQEGRFRTLVKGRAADEAKGPASSEDPGPGPPSSSPS